MTLIDLRNEYKKLTGDNNIPLSHEFYRDAAYVVWLEDELLKHVNLKMKLIPWEKLGEIPDEVTLKKSQLKTEVL